MGLSSSKKFAILKLPFEIQELILHFAGITAAHKYSNSCSVVRKHFSSNAVFDTFWKLFPTSSPLLPNSILTLNDTLPLYIQTIAMSQNRMISSNALCLVFKTAFEESMVKK